MKVLIIEDEIDARKVLLYLIKQFFPKFEIVGETGELQVSKKLIKQYNPDLIFLDIELEDGVGLNLLQDCLDRKFYTIITTAYANFAIEAIKYNVNDYLLKPIVPDELKKAVEKVIEQKVLEVEIKKLKNTVEKKESESKLVLNTLEGTFVVPIQNIIRMEADGAYTKIITSEKIIVVSKNIKYYQKILPTDIFIRTHQSHLVNKTRILKINKTGDLLLSNKDLIPVSFRKKSYVRNLLKK